MFSRKKYTWYQNLLFGKIKKKADYFDSKMRIGVITSCALKEFVGMLRHERMIHLIVLSVTTFVFFLFTALMILFPYAVTAIIFTLTTVMELCYFHYYCFLENMTQKYEFMQINDMIRKGISQKFERETGI